MASEADHGVVPLAAADPTGPLYLEIKDGPVLLHQPGPGVPQKPLLHYRQQLLGLRALSMGGPQPGAHAYAVLLQGDLHGLHSYDQKSFFKRLKQEIKKGLQTSTIKHMPKNVYYSLYS